MTTSATHTIELNLDPSISAEIDEIARATERDRTSVIDDAIGTYLDNYRRQLEHIRRGVADAEAGNFASDEELAAFFALKA